jgi:hypothetical protein
MRYLLLIYDSEAQLAGLPEHEVSQVMQEYGKFTAALQESGAYVASNRLRPVNTAKSVRVRNGDALWTDGPFAETKEQLGGFYLIDVRDLKEASQWAAKVPSARFGTIEIRPIWE